MLFPHGAVDADAAGAYEQDDEEGYEIKIRLFVGHPGCHRHMAFVRPEFGHAHADDGYQRGKAGEKAKCDQQAAKQLGEDDEDQGNAVAKMEWVGKDVFEVAEVPELVDTIIKAEDEAEGYPQGENGDVESAFAVCGRKEFFHVRLGFGPKIMDDRLFIRKC